jgi:NAD(P)-dependent dehydrogenase (short-subunit alcohol dehydrogenase family)
MHFGAGYTASKAGVVMLTKQAATPGYPDLRRFMSGA